MGFQLQWFFFVFYFSLYKFGNITLLLLFVFCISYFLLFFKILLCRDSVGGWQVDVDMIDGLLTSLVEYLQLENAYNIFILNPKHGEKMPKYGYR